MTNRKTILALLTGASVWGVIWYPYRLLNDAGIDGVASTVLTYLIALILGGVFLGARVRSWRGGWPVVFLGLSAGWTNLAYVLAVIDGEVVRVLFLFYLAPLWTLVFAYYLLDERLTRGAFGVVGLALGGAIVMLWHPEFGMPLPANWAEWLAISSGAAFALTNVLTRRATQASILLKAFSVWIGVFVVAAAVSLIRPPDWHAVAQADATTWAWLAVVGLSLFVATVVMQYGLTYTPANRAIIILLFELVVVAVSSYFLADEALSVREWIGGAMIIAASFFSERMEHRPT